MIRPGIIFIRRKDDPLNFRNSRAQMFSKLDVLENFAQYLQKKTSVLESLFNKV